MCLGTCAVAVPQRITIQNQPYIFTDAPSPEESSQLTADFIGKQAAPGKAQYAGNDATKSKYRGTGSPTTTRPTGSTSSNSTR